MRVPLEVIAPLARGDQDREFREPRAQRIVRCLIVQTQLERGYDQVGYAEQNGPWWSREIGLTEIFIIRDGSLLGVNILE